MIGRCRPVRNLIGYLIGYLPANLPARKSACPTGAGATDWAGASATIPPPRAELAERHHAGRSGAGRAGLLGGPPARAAAEHDRRRVPAGVAGAAVLHGRRCDLLPVRC